MSFPRYPAYKDSGVEWIKDLPRHWEAKQFQRCVDVAEGQVDPEDPDYSSLPLIAPNHVESGTGRLLELEFADDQGAQSGKYACKAGDVIYSKIRPALRKVCLAPEECLCSADMYPLRAHSGLSNPFLLWFMLSEQFSSVAILESQRVAMPKINRETLKEITLAVPPIVEQIHIAAFLDRETAKVDALMAEQWRLIELLKEKSQAVVSHAVTKGLNPNALLKPSGIEWFGDVPAHWRVVPLGKVTISRCDGPFGSGLKSDHYTDSGVRVVRLQNIRRDGFNGTDEAFIDAVYYESELSGHDVISGDLLVAGLGDDNNTVGRACVAPVGIEPAMVKADCFRFRLDKTQVLPAFVATALSASAAADAGILSSGSTRSRISLSMMATRKLVAPPISEQKEIASFVQAEMAKFDMLAVEARRAIDLLQERRAALISAAVTGAIDVRELNMADAA